MSDIYFFGFMWPNAFWFLAGPAALIALVWFFLESGRNARKVTAGITVLLTGIFVFSASGATGEPFRPDFAYSSFGPDVRSEIERRFFSEQRQPVIFYFHADWCLNCPELENKLSRKDLSASLKDTLVVSIDLSDEKSEHYAHDEFHLHGLPALAVSDCTGKPVKGGIFSGTEFPTGSFLSVIQYAKEVSAEKCQSL